MTKRKYKIFIDIVLVLLCVFPLIVTALMCFKNSDIYTSGDFTEIINRFSISDELANKIGESINTFGIDFDGAYFPAVCVLMSNSMLIYIFYVFVAVLTWLPKFAINFMERIAGQKY